MQDHLPDDDRHRGVGKLQYDIQTIFVKPVPDQFRAVEQAVVRPRARRDPRRLGLRRHPPAAARRPGDPAGRCSRRAWCRSASRAADVAPYGLGLPPMPRRARAAAQPHAQRAGAAGAVPQDAASSPTARCARSVARARYVRARLLAHVRPVPAALARRVRVPPQRPLGERALRRHGAAAGAGRGPAARVVARARWRVAPSCTSPRARSTTRTSTGSCARRSTRSPTSTCSSWSRPAAGRWPSSASCPRMRAPPSSCPTTCCCRRPTCSSRTPDSAARSTR